MQSRGLIVKLGVPVLVISGVVFAYQQREGATQRSYARLLVKAVDRAGIRVRLDSQAMALVFTGSADGCARLRSIVRESSDEAPRYQIVRCVVDGSEVWELTMP